MITINNSNPPNKWIILIVAILLFALAFALIRGCKKSKKEVENARLLKAANDSLISLNRQTKIQWGASDKAYQDSIEFERGQRLLAENQKERTEDELSKSYAVNKALIDKYESGKYTDTTVVTAPAEFIVDCHSCFTRLKISNELTLRYKKEVSDWGVKYEQETARILGRYNEVKNERDSYFRKVDSLTNKQEKAIDKIQQKGRLYLSWGVQWQPFPTYAGAGLMYQTKRNMMYGAKWYYGSKGHMVETTINFPLSLRK